MKCNWIPRHVENAPKTLDAIHREIEEEERIKKIEIKRLDTLDAAKRASQGGRCRGGHYGQQSSLKSASLDLEKYNRPQNVGNALTSVKKITIGTNAPLDFRPSTLSINPQHPKSIDTSRSQLQTHYNDADPRRGSMPCRPTKQFPQQQQPQQDVKKQVDRVKQMDRSETSSLVNSRYTSRCNSVTREATSS